MSTGPDHLPNRLLKATSSFILAPLTKIINLSIESGVFPKIWKETQISPVHKSGSKSIINKYRPIALTSNLGKVLEGIIHDQYNSHLDSILPSNMFGFRSNRSTQDAISSLLDRVKTLKASGKTVAVLSVDASAAFDLLSHELVLGSLKILGFGPRMIAWVQSFFHDCPQHVRIGASKSSSWTMDVGVGQGRKPSPDLFNIGYLTQCLWSIISEYFGYADDGMDVIAADSIVECNKKIQQVADLRAAWFDAAGLPINTAKTELMGIGFTPVPISINAAQICPSMSIKFLGCTIQSNLKWNEHITSICKKVRFAASRIRNEGKYFSIGDKTTLYNGWILGLVHSNGLAYLPCATKEQLSEIQCALNSGIRAIFNIPKFGYAPLSELRNKLRLPSIHNIRDKILMMHAWRIRDQFSIKTEGPTTRSRAKGNLPQPDQKGILGTLTSTLTICAWNKAPLSVKLAPNAASAKREIKKLLYVDQPH